MVDTRVEALGFPCGDVDLGFCDACGFIQNCRYDPSLQVYSPAYEETQAPLAQLPRCSLVPRQHAVGGPNEVGSDDGNSG
jgi:hypothetical protein